LYVIVTLHLDSSSVSVTIWCQFGLAYFLVKKSDLLPMCQQVPKSTWVI